MAIPFKLLKKISNESYFYLAKISLGFSLKPR